MTMSDPHEQEGQARPAPTPRAPRRWLFLGLGLPLYLLLQLVVVLAGAFWNPWSPNPLLPLLVLLSGAVLVGVCYRPRFFKDPYVERLLLATGGVLLGVECVIAWLAPYTVGKDYLSLYHAIHAYELNPLLFAPQSLLVFLVGLGHAARLGSLGTRLLLLDAPALATFVLQVWLGQHMPEYTG